MNIRALIALTIFSITSSLPSWGQTVIVPQSGHNANHNCAIIKGALYCWGNNDYGQLGDGYTFSTTVPQMIIPSGVTQVSLGGEHTCAVVSGALKCWGDNTTGMYGDGTSDSSMIPKTIITSGVSQVSIGLMHVCALISGRVKCWGNNDYGQLGDGTTDPQASVIPQQVTAITGTVYSLQAGAYNTCVQQSSSVKCWGANDEGQLGQGNTTPSATNLPVAVPGITTLIKQLRVGYTHTCVVQGESLKCWGGNAAGQVGDGFNVATSSPATIYSTGITRVELGQLHTCAIRLGALKCWGENGKGQLGNDTTDDSLTPITIVGLAVTGLTLGKEFTCAIIDGVHKCWGVNSSGQVGDGTETERHLPTNVAW